MEPAERRGGIGKESMRNRDELKEKSMKNRGGIMKETGIEENLEKN